MCKTNYLLLRGGGAYNPLSSTEGALNALEPSGPQEKKEKCLFLPFHSKEKLRNIS